MAEQELKKTEQEPKKTEQEPKKTEQGPKKVEQEPKKTDQEPKKTEQEPKKVEEEPKKIGFRIFYPSEERKKQPPDKIIYPTEEKKKKKKKEDIIPYPTEEKIEKKEDKILYPTTELKTKMKSESIIPDVLAEYPPALEILEVTYGKDDKVQIGNILTPTKVKDVPVVKWRVEPDRFYLICMVDPDAPSRENPVMREWHHWLVGNIPGDEIDEGEILSEYIGSGPPKDSGKHRYVFLLYKQNKKLDFTEHHLTNKATKNRARFSIKTFAEKYKLGEPIAGNFFLAEYDNYVPKMYEKLNCC